mmetsp:Transcript_120700/g.348750  ORF Transcript_120700/g.348750 Transcript_120700/m.348750 type:complete len:280 (-) Transcript_120700:290-1129(-)
MAMERYNMDLSRVPNQPTSSAYSGAFHISVVARWSLVPLVRQTPNVKSNRAKTISAQHIKRIERMIAKIMRRSSRKKRKTRITFTTRTTRITRTVRSVGALAMSKLSPAESLLANLKIRSKRLQRTTTMSKMFHTRSRLMKKPMQPLAVQRHASSALNTQKNSTWKNVNTTGSASLIGRPSAAALRASYPRNCTCKPSKRVLMTTMPPVIHSKYLLCTRRCISVKSASASVRLREEMKSPASADMALIKVCLLRISARFTDSLESPNDVRMEPLWLLLA